MSTKEQIVLFGAGGHARVVADAVKTQGRYIISAVVDPGKAGTEFQGMKVQADEKDLAPNNFIVALGDNLLRRKVFCQLEESGWAPVVVQHSSAIVASDAKIASGTVLFARSIVNPNSTIGKNCIINSGAIVEHDCHIESHAHIATGACLAGTVKIGEGTLIGVGCSILPNLSIGSWSILGGGSVAISDVPANSTAAGVPARIKKVRQDITASKV
jgi:sugar O-acyltransferase (sialic acid O-acetyltransferase NeuD family)